jgi:hypothetical protein
MPSESIAPSAFPRNNGYRRTCRMILRDAVPREVIEQAILAAGTAPSGANHQPWHFAVSLAQSQAAHSRCRRRRSKPSMPARLAKEWLEALAPLGTDADKDFLEAAPYLIVVFGQRRGRD